MRDADPQTRARSDALTVAAAAVAALGFGWYFALAHAGIQRWDLASLERLSEGRGIVPMQYRILLPGLIGAIRSHGPPVLQALSYRAWESGLDQVAVFATWASLSVLIRRCAGVPLGASSLLALLALPALLVHYVTLRADYFYVYDLPSVAFFTAGIVASLQRRRWLLVPLFAIGTLNRETMLFVAFADFLAWAPRRDERGRTVARLVGLVAIWVALKLVLREAFRENVDPAYSSDLFMTVYERNANNLIDDPTVVGRYWGSAFAYWWIPLVALYGRIRATEIGRMLLILPPFWLLMGCVGLLEEVRIFGELLPLVFTGMIVLVIRELRGTPPAGSAG